MVVIGILVGLEIPLLMRILKERFEFRELVAHVLTFDYLGALGASLLFPILLVPKPGSSARPFCSVGECRRGLWSTFLFRDQLGASMGLRLASALVIIVLGAGMAEANRITDAADNSLYADDVILARNTRYQRIVLTRWKDDVRLFSERPPPIQLARRVPLPRSPRTSWSGRCPRSAPRARPGWRRWPGGARDP